MKIYIQFDVFFRAEIGHSVHGVLNESAFRWPSQKNLNDQDLKDLKPIATGEAERSSDESFVLVDLEGLSSSTSANE